MSDEVVPISTSTSARLLSDGTIEREDPAISSLPAGIVGVTVGGFPGIGMKDANGIVRSAITFADNGALILSVFAENGAMIADAGLASTTPGQWFWAGPNFYLALPAGTNASALEASDPLVAGQVWNNGGVLTVSAGVPL